MQHPCYQCGKAVEDGTAFCPYCSAPQIRVASVEAAPGTEVLEERLPPAHLSQSILRSGPSVQWPQALPAAFLGLLIASLLSPVLKGALGFGMLAMGFLSVYFYRRRNPFSRLTLGLGARLGALSGIFGFGILAAAFAIAIAIFHSGAEIHAIMLKAITEYVSRSSDPQMEQVLNLYGTRQGFILMLVVASIMMFTLFLALAGIGGLIGAALLRRKESI